STVNSTTLAGVRRQAGENARAAARGCGAAATPARAPRVGPRVGRLIGGSAAEMARLGHPARHRGAWGCIATVLGPRTRTGAQIPRASSTRSRVESRSWRCVYGHSGGGSDVFAAPTHTPSQHCAATVTQLSPPAFARHPQEKNSGPQ